MTIRSVGLLLLVAAASLVAARPDVTVARCTDGVWVIDDGPLAVGPLAIGHVRLDEGRPAIDAPCRALRWGLAHAEAETHVRALFVCRYPEAERRRLRRFALRLHARIVDECQRMEGAFGARRLGMVARFTATRSPYDCASNAECRENAYCAKEAGACDARGVCRGRPTACPDVVDPVCGCDRVTYGNACEAAAAGVSIARRGPCSVPCGGIAGVPCGKGEFCDLPAGQCGSADLEGRCVEVHEACPEFYAPVCGCDGVTYANECFRQAAKVQKDHDGACDDACMPKAAPCMNACDCYAALGHAFCSDCLLLCPNCGDYWQCKEGTCVEQCGMLPPDVIECFAPAPCGGIAGLRCPAGQVCDIGLVFCEAPAAEGVCVPRGACTLEYDPVCGCDGKTYGNDCERRQNGVALAHRGPCDDTRAR
ncbi:MAG TPA: Kazal-type serine protease inhibitor domain-containing protein [Candidatus Limnocylindria bacterium]|nr:Kazal-type serine protease inhibitor domain-containing protein [Candidatus Limnocylindria bacterium]